MTPRTILTISNTATFICTACDRQWTEDVSRYFNVPSMVELEVSCNCGHAWKTILERRRYYRKNVNFPGTFKHESAVDDGAAGTMTVVDISRKGLKIKLDEEEMLIEKGDCFEVTFPLDNDGESIIKRDVTVNNIFKLFLGVEFTDTKHEDIDIKVYMSQ